MTTFNPSRLKEIRVIREFTLEQVAAGLGVTKQMVSKYETGLSMPQREALVKMAMFFSAPLAFFYKPSIDFSYSCSALFFRTTSNTSGKEVASARISNQWSFEITEAIDSLWGLPKADIPTFETGINVINKANLLRDHWGLGVSPIDNLTELLEAHGIFVTTVSSSALKTDGYSQIVNGIPVIVINRDRGSAVRQRFSLAHELGHLVLHRNLSETEYKLHEKEYESEADLFANSFLLPKLGFDPMVHAAELEHFVYLKKVWKVSIAAMIYHCIQNRILPVKGIEYMRNNKLYRLYGRKVEPLDDIIPLEQPSLLSKSLTRHVFDQDSFDRFYSIASLPLDSLELLAGLKPGCWADYYGNGDDWVNVAYSSSQPYYGQMTLFELEV
ncbi:MAG: XRE family transcriptional regulator [Eggerthellaceae bacterium]|nr:XRE family transcriptional regulator [Eggerthellaceae bacterium]